jgi:ERCC4-related helicase
MALQLYPHQKECIDHALDRNTIVCLPTGFGKTLIACTVIEHFLRLYPDKRVAFLVPTRPLVEQQAAYCATHCRVDAHTTAVVQRLVGQDQADWRQQDWDACMRKSNILLGTAALFQKVLVTDKYLSVSRFSLFVFDECHNAVGNSPMAAVMRDGVAPHAARGLDCPQILGLTASFVNGNLRNMESKRQTLESLLLSTIICPTVQPKIADDKYKYVTWDQGKGLEQEKEAIARHVEGALAQVGHIKEMKKVISRCSHVFIELGTTALFFYIDKVIVQQIVDKASLLKEQDEAGIRCARRVLNGLPALREQLGELARKLNSDPLVKRAAPKSMKLERLIRLIDEIFAANNDTYRGIIFVEQVALVSSLAKQLNDSLAPRIKGGAVAGTGYQNQSDRQTQLDKFKNGDINILVATATLEEGIDVSECAFVVRYTSISTTKAHIQGAGRARHPNAVIYYFENNPVLERQKEAAMTATAKNKSLSLTPSELQTAILSMSVSVDQRHPYPFTTSNAMATVDTGEVSVFNCKQIFNQYCSSSLGTSVRPAVDLYTYANKPGNQKIISRVRYPTPEGWRGVTETEYKQFWSGVDLELVFSPDRVKRKTSSEKEEMCFVYIVVVELREKGFLDQHNGPDQKFRFETKRNCSLTSTGSPGISIRNRVFQSSTSHA